MDFSILGRTGLKVSVVGLGTGGYSRLGQSYGLSQNESIRIIERAIELGVNLIDTAEQYGTEVLVGKAIHARRKSVILSTKNFITEKRWFRYRPISAKEFENRLNTSLKALDTDYIDIYNMHAVLPEHLDYACNELLPVMTRAKEQGKIRFLGLTEDFLADPSHTMLSRALQTNVWDTIMVGFNLLNSSARLGVLPVAQKNNIGVMGMYSVRKGLKDHHAFLQIWGKMRALNLGLANSSAEQFLKDLHSSASSVSQAAYRFTRHEPGIHTVLTGTGRLAHLEENIDSCNQPPLAEEFLSRRNNLLGSIATVTGD